MNMKHRRILTVVSFLLAIALPAAAELVKNKDWDKSPEFTYLATDAERKAWKDLKSDQEAEKFIALFWAKRDPDLKTPVNEFRVKFDALVEQADQAFPLAKRRGSLTERGKALILIGRPKTATKAAQSAQESTFGDKGIGASQFGGADALGPRTVRYQFTWEKEQLPAWADLKRLEAGFLVDEATSTESLAAAGPLRKLEAKAAEVALVHPELKEPPVYKTREQAEAEMKAAAEAAAEAKRGPTLTPAVRAALEETLKKEPFGEVTAMSVAYRNAATALMVQLYAKGSAVPKPEETKLAILVRGKDGKDAARREEPAALQKTKGDVFADRSILVPPGDYDVAVALLDASGAVLASGRRSAAVAALPTEFGASALLIACNDFPFESAKPEDPFVFFQRKFVGHGDGHLEKTDGLSYVLRIYNPAVDPVKKTMFLKKSVKVKAKGGGPAIDVPQAADEPIPVPEMKDGNTALVLDLAANIVEANIGEYFQPGGEFTLKLTVTDAVANKTVETSATFRVTGTPTPPAPAPKKKG